MTFIRVYNRVSIYMWLCFYFQSKSLRITTPLTGRKYIKESNPYVTPVSIATYSLSRLHTMLAGLKNAPSENLEQILR